MICPRCQSENIQGARYCNDCGTTLGSASPSESKKPDPLIGRLVDGKYRIVSKLGSGGMGVVYAATRPLIGDKVAIKILHKEHSDDPHAAGRFQREAQTSARLKHPNAVSIYDFGVTQDGLQYLVMELIEGQSLREVIKQKGRINPTGVAAIAQQLCAALDEAHRQDIIHRDIKPDNIIIHQSQDGLRVKVLDFGIAKLRDQTASNLTQTGSVMGTPHYMSPEQCLGEEMDCRSDIYSLGCVLYEMLCGVVPFNAPISTAVVVQHVTQPPPPLHEKNRAITPEVERVVLRALEKRPEARPASAGLVAKELDAAVNRSARFAKGSVASAPVFPASRKSRTNDFDDESTVLKDAAVSTPVAGSVTAGMSTTVLLKEQPGLKRGAASQAGRASSSASAKSWQRRKTSRRLMAAAVAVVILAAAVGTFVWMRQPEEDREQEQVGPASGEKTENEKATKEQATHKDAPVKTLSSEPASPTGMVYVPGGEFVMGRNDGNDYERPAHRVAVKPFFIDAHEVTNEEYQNFVQATNYRPPLTWRNGTYPAGAAQKPVTGVTWDDANNYARWATKRLPTEEEWELAARGLDNRLYPWGAQWQQGMANANGAVTGFSDAGAFKGKSPYGALDMVGNAWEWTASTLAAYPGGRLPKQKMAGELKVIRGGSYESDPTSATTTFRQGYPATGQKYLNTGFRCVRNISPSSGS
jgi:serine/threonine-protein kinase